MSTIVTRTGKGSSLTYAEADANFTNLNTDKWEDSNVASATSKTTPVDGDSVPIIDSAASNVRKRLTWANLKATLKTYFDTLYALTGAVTTSGLTQATGKLLGRSTASTGAIEEITVGSGLTLSAGSLTATGFTPSASNALAGSIIQTKYTQSQAAVVGAGTAIPYDNTIPQITEGDLFLTAPALTPNNASNILRVTVHFSASENTNSSTYLTVAVFQDSNANAVAVMTRDAGSQAGVVPAPMTFVYYMVAGTTSETTFTVRAGLDTANPVCMNGNNSATLFGGKLTSSITVEEIKV